MIFDTFTLGSFWEIRPLGGKMPIFAAPFYGPSVEKGYNHLKISCLRTFLRVNKVFIQVS
jgi:hypothetical protein